MVTDEGPQLTRGGPVTLPKMDEVQEYEKILTISDEIFAGTHPRLRVPQQFIRRVPPRALQAPAAAKMRTPKAEAPGSQVKTQPPIPSTQPASMQIGSSITKKALAGPSASVSSGAVPKNSSDIDPIFLTKSDDLVRAEIQLQRQRMERGLREQLDRKSLEARQKPSLQEVKPDFDVSDVLAKALEIVKPVPPSDVHKANRTTAPSDSFDENSFYSSKAPDSPQQEDIEHTSLDSERQVQPMVAEGLTTDVPADHHSNELERLEAANQDLMDMDKQESLQNIDKRLPLQRQPINAAAHTVPPENYPPTREREDAFDEPEYSPPGPDIPSADRKHSREYRYGRKRRAERRRVGRRSLSPASDVRIIRNHITSPAAPQPSRVSPLAVVKMPSVQQPRPSQQDHVERVPTGQDSERTSPETGGPRFMRRKRRRAEEPRDQLRQIQLRRQSDSPVPYIKEEPTSPAPLVGVPPATSSRAQHPQERPVYIEIPSPRYTPVVERRDLPGREPVYEFDRYGSIRDYDAPIETNITQAVSRLGSGGAVRDSRDLRRIANLQHTRHPDASREFRDPVPTVNPRPARAPPYTVIEHPPHQDRAKYYDEMVPSYPKRYGPVDELPSSPNFREAYLDEEPPRIISSQRRIVIDEHGNQYYETIPAPKMQPMPPPASRLSKVDTYTERPARSASVRGPSIIEDQYGDRRYVQEMPPPPPTYRRVVDYPRGSLDERRSYVRPLDEREPAFRSSSVVVDYSPRHATYIDEHDIPRERLIRMPSTRPPRSPYRDSRDAVQGAPSVRPGGGEESVYVDDEARHPREFVDRPVYVAPRPVREQRFYEEEAPDRMILDGPREVIHRVPQQY